jgi:ATP-dependent helicase HrpB
VLTPLPVDPFIPHIEGALQAARAVIVTAPPGAGKTTRVPPALVPGGPVIVLEPRRVAARALAQHVAAERGWTIGREIGWHVRFERRFGPDTRLLVATEGILTARLQRDPLLADFRTIVLDEFHERSIHGDLALTLARQAWKARDDLRIVVMSATVDAGAVARFLGGCPIVEVESRLHPLDISYTPQQSMAAAADELLAATTGDVLCFLPGVAEIQRTIAQLQSTVDRRSVDVLPLHGSLDAAEQDAAVRGAVAGRRRVIVATNIAETSLTVPGITGVVDSGLCKVARYDADRAIDSLTTERISQASADQRAGRAGRTAAGQVRRMWERLDRLRPHTEPEIHRVDLSSVALDVLAWGGDPRDLEWFDPPPPDALDRAIDLLRRLGAVSGRQLTATGREISRLPLHPRLATMLHAARGARSAARACALLSDRQLLPPRSAATTSSDLLSALDRWTEIPPHVDRVARQLEQLYASVSPAAARAGHDTSEDEFRRAVFAGYPDRIAQRRNAGSPRVRLATGGGAVLGGESGVRDGEFLAAVDLRSQPGEARVRIASRVDREWLIANAIELVHTFDVVSGTVRAAEVERYDALILRERPIPPEPEEAARLLADAWLSRGADTEDEQLLRRLRFAGHTIDLPAAVRLAAYGHRALADVRLSSGVPADVLRTLDAVAPRMLSLPSGKHVRLEYLDDGCVKAAARLQDVFGLFETPRLGPARQPVLFALLAPSGRPVQLTTDLRSFWERTYPEVRKELRGRYPKHRWPENPHGPSKASAT